MPISLGIVMDPPETLKPLKDSSLAMLQEARHRHWKTYYISMSALAYDEQPVATLQPISVDTTQQPCFELGPTHQQPLKDLDVILMRKDPPFNMAYIYATYLLELAEKQGVMVVNKPQSLRDANEKLFTLRFPQCCPPTRVASESTVLKSFLDLHQDVILKPLDGMGGASIFRLRPGDANLSVILETLTRHGQLPIIAQKYIPEITAGDKRILLINGQPVPYALARVPAKGETRANLAAGGTGVGVALTERDLWICQQVAPTLVEMGLVFVGLDVIGDYLTEINVTSPTCIRELDKIYDLNISAILMDHIAQHLK